MLKRALSLLLPMLLPCCGASSPSPANPKPLSLCKVPAWPSPPPLHPTACQADQVCLSVEDTVALARYEFDVEQTLATLMSCPLIVVTK